MVRAFQYVATASLVVGTVRGTKYGVGGVYNGLARTPQMGWDNWNALGCSVSQDLLTQTAQLIVNYGLRDVGYEYVILDDCWSNGRSANGSLVPDYSKFPEGMTAVADNMHDLGLRFGMYSSAGSMTCGGYAGSLGYETIDAQTFASWGVDYLKYDNCYNEGESGTPLITYTRYKAMSDALNATGRPILYSMCNWGEDYPWKWAQTIGNSWRMSGDIYDSFDVADENCPCTGDEGYDCALPGFHCSMMNILNKYAPLVSKSQPGAWNDLDMLEVGNGGMTDTEYVTHFSLWAATKSPLIMGNDVRVMTPSALSILTNPAVIAISQDPSGSSITRRWRYWVNDTDISGKGEIQLWSGSLAYGDYVVVLLNAGSAARPMNATLEDIFWLNGPGGTASQVKQAWDIYDVWANRMPNATAAAIIAANGTSGVDISQYYWNATQMSYADGLAANSSMLMGNYTGTVQPMGTINTEVEAHGLKMFRLRLHASGSATKRDEL
ncbi:glycoside hydrolase family 27 protein [Hygrophoropsis aurantiaca]|uniref:Glycoside hydrolase family 27 protein n=1 Tax=Hygrophoropsis aurantiaca TaxID=72124 RepID=A0ACB8AIV2_9AGAM|nr:glycoside hydrolase family 27 protein [Hygrophoropsis aurantiaca]